MKKVLYCLTALILLNLNTYQVFANWPMSGANPMRTSWVSEQLKKEVLVGHWAVPFEPYLMPKTQPVVANGKVLVATGKGVWALNANNGQTLWSYTTQMPIGQSPSIDVENNVVYAPGLDHKLYALNLNTGQKIWEFKANAGFSSNPLIIKDSFTNNQPLVIVGNRDGNVYAINGVGASNAGQKKWQFNTNAPIFHSQAYYNGVVYTGSHNTNAYAINVNNGSQKWVNSSLPTSTFQSWWPVVYKENSGQVHIIFTASPFSTLNMGQKYNIPLNEYTWKKVWPNYDGAAQSSAAGKFGYEPGDWAPNTPTLDFSKVNDAGDSVPPVEVFRKEPDLRVVFVLDPNTGNERKYNMDGKGEHFAPILQNSNNGGPNQPPMVNEKNGVIYFWMTQSAKGTYFAYSPAMGWKEGTPFFSINLLRPTWDSFPGDEPVGLSGGGDLVYFNMIDDRMVGGFDSSQPVSENYPDIFTKHLFSNNRQWRYESPSSNWRNQLSGYNQNLLRYQFNLQWVLEGRIQGGEQGDLFYNHSEVAGPSVYNGRIYLNRGNAIVALGPNDSTKPVTGVLPNVKMPTNYNSPAISDYTLNELNAQLESQVTKIINEGKLGSVVWPIGIQNFKPLMSMGNLDNIYSDPFSNYVPLIKALPHLTPGTQTNLKNYLKQEYQQRPLTSIAIYGVKDGANRAYFTYPSDVQPRVSNSSGYCCNQFNSSIGWNFPPTNMYALYLYARDVLDGNQQQAQTLLNQAKANNGLIKYFDPSEPRYPTPSKDGEHPNIYNAYITGHIGYLKLLELAGQKNSSEWTKINNQLNTLLQQRASNFKWHTKTTLLDEYWYYNTPVWNFMYLVPELSTYLRQNSKTDNVNSVNAVINDYSNRAPIWFLALNTEAQGEGSITHPLHYHSLFQAKAQIQNASYQELAKYLDVPVFRVGDMYYIDNLVEVIKAAKRDGVEPGPTVNPTVTITPTPTPTVTVNPTPNYNIKFDVNKDGFVNITDAIDIIKFMFGVN